MGDGSTFSCFRQTFIFLWRLLIKKKYNKNATTEWHGIARKSRNKSHNSLRHPKLVTEALSLFTLLKIKFTRKWGCGRGGGGGPGCRLTRPINDAGAALVQLMVLANKSLGARIMKLVFGEGNERQGSDPPGYLDRHNGGTPWCTAPAKRYRIRRGSYHQQS